MSDQTEHHKISASDGEKEGVVTLLEVATKTAKGMPEDKRYDVEIEIKESS